MKLGISSRMGICLLAILLPGGFLEDVRAEAHKLRIVTSFLPVFCFTVNVTGDLAEVENLLPPGAEPHDFQFTPREVKLLSTADMVVVNGLQLESWLDRAMLSSGNPRYRVEAAAGLKSELITTAPYLDLAGAGSAGHQETSAPNPHIWLDPLLAAHAVTNILEALQKADPAHASAYAVNAAHYISRLEELDAEFRAGLTPFKDEPVVMFHDAYPYFARRYGLKIAGVIEQLPDVQPSPKYLGALGGVIRREKVKVIFADRQFSPKLPDQIGRDYGVPVARLDTLETGKFEPAAYEEGMRYNLQTLEKCLK